MGKFDPDRFKTQLKLAKCRLENMLKQHRNSSSGRRREIANLLQSGHEDRARVNVKYLIRDDYLMEAYEMLITACEDLIQSAGLIARERTLEQDLVPPAKSLLYASGRIDVPELDRVKEQLEIKLGREFTDVNSELGKTNVDPSLVVKLSIRTPDVRLVNKYLLAIAQIFGVPWESPPEEPLLHTGEQPVVLERRHTPPPTGSLNPVPVGPPPPAIPFTSHQSGTTGELPKDYTANPPPPYSPDLGHAPPVTDCSGHQRSQSGSSADSTLGQDEQGLRSSATAAPSTSVPDFEELTKRFLALKGENKK